MSEANDSGASVLSNPVQNQEDRIRWILDGVQEQIRFADSKAAFVALFHTFLFGLIVAQSDALSVVAHDCRGNGYWLRIVALLCYMVVSGISIRYAIAAVLPRRGEGAPRCMTYFGHIVRDFGRDYGKYGKIAAGRTESEWFEDLTSQVVENSNIANEKHRLAASALRWAIAAVLLAFAAIALTLLLGIEVITQT